MKTKELIEELQKADPSGEEECCVGNEPILYLDMEPAYYDGSLQILVKDTSPHHRNVISGKMTTKGHKVQIHLYSVQDAMWDNSELEVEIDHPRDATTVTRWRDEVLDYEKRERKKKG